MSEGVSLNPKGRSTERPPQVSVVIPAYNAAPFIKDTLDSVLAQTYRDYEVILVNDGSPDTEELERVLAPYQERIRYLKQENRGLSGARNTAILASNSPLIALLDADDVWEPNYLEVQAGAMAADPTIDVVYPDALIFGEGPDVGKRYMELFPSKGEVTFERLVRGECYVLVSVLARRETLLRVGLFDDAIRDFSEDFDMWARIAREGGKIVYHHQVLVRRRRWPGSMAADDAMVCRRFLAVLEKYRHTLDLTPGEREALEQSYAYSHALLRLAEGKQAFMRGQHEEAARGVQDANAYFASPRLSLILFALRRAPGLLLRAHDLRDRWGSRGGARFSRQSTA